MLEQETPFDYSQEEDAYFNFMENIGFTNALVIIKSLLSEIKDGYKNIFVAGFSAGATVAWLCSEERLVDGIIGYYGSVLEIIWKYRLNARNCCSFQKKKNCLMLMS
jgi:dienelactone hydrolase